MEQSYNPNEISLNFQICFASNIDPHSTHRPFACRGRTGVPDLIPWPTRDPMAMRTPWQGHPPSKMPLVLSICFHICAVQTTTSSFNLTCGSLLLCRFASPFNSAINSSRTTTVPGHLLVMKARLSNSKLPFRRDCVPRPRTL